MSEVSFSDWSGRHTRLRYQVVLTAMVLNLVSYLGVSSVGLPGFIALERPPREELVVIALIAFWVFSAVSFHLQHKVEKQALSFPADKLGIITRSISERYAYKKGEEFEFFDRLIELLKSKNAAGKRKGIQVFSSPERAQFHKYLDLLAENRAYIKSGNYLAEEFVRVFPNRLSEASAFVGLKHSIDDDLDEFRRELLVLDGLLDSSEQVWLTRFGSLAGKGVDIQNQAEQLTKMVSDSDEDVSSYLKTRRFHSEILAFKIPMTVSGAFVLSSMLGMIHG